MNTSSQCDPHLSISRHEPSQNTFRTTLVAGLEDAEESNLLVLIKHGTNRERVKAVSIIYDQHCEKVAQMIDRKGIPKADAEDIFGEVWKIILEKLPLYEYRGKPIWYWISRITKIQIKAYYRIKHEQNGRFQQTSDEWFDLLVHVKDVFDDKPVSELSPHIKKLIDHTLPKLLSTLSVEEKDVIILSFYHDMDSTQIAAKLGIKPGTVRQKKRRALAKLAQLGKKGE